jgi:hypothetical protein
MLGHIILGRKNSNLEKYLEPKKVTAKDVAE